MRCIFIVVRSKVQKCGVLYLDFAAFVGIIYTEISIISSAVCGRTLASEDNEE